MLNYLPGKGSTSILFESVMVWKGPGERGEDLCFGRRKDFVRVGVARKSHSRLRIDLLILVLIRKHVLYDI